MSKPNAIVKAAISSKDFITSHRTAIAVVAAGAATAAATTVVFKWRGETQLEFIKESGLVEQYGTWLSALTD